MSFSERGLPAPLRACAIAALQAFVAPVAGAQSPAPPASLQAVVVSATRTPQPLSEVLADVSVLERIDIERSGASNIADLLARLPGIEFARNGGPGANTSVYLRGGESRHTAVYLDGVRIDSQSTGGAIWEQIPLQQIERIEVLRGPAAAVYGSDAVAGVVQLFTRRGEAGMPRPSAALTLGAHETVQAQAGLAGGGTSYDYALTLSGARSDGQNARHAPTANPDDDGWRRGALQARVGWQLAPAHRLEAAWLTSRLHAQYDGSLANDDLADQALDTASLTWQGRWSDTATTSAQLGESRSRYETRPSAYRTETTLRNLLLQHEQRIGSQRWSVALERREDRLENPLSALEGQRAQNALGLGWRGDFGDHALQAHWRHDRDSEFGGQDTGSLAWGWRFAPAWRLSASAASSFRAPTLYQRFSAYGVATLVPERGHSAELGLRWAEAGSELGATLWRNRVTDLIVFDAPGPCASTFGCYANVGRARYQGLTLSGRHQLGSVALRGSIDWHDPRNLDTDLQLARRARRLATFGADTMLAGWDLGVEAQAAGARYDNAANTTRPGGYTLLNLRAGRALQPGLRIEARVDNLADKRYELARTYATAGRNVQLGLSWAWP